jgi:hypothetical protein
MGAFNAYEIQQLKSKFSNLHSGHNMLVRVTNQHDKDIKDLSDNMKSIMDVIDLGSILPTHNTRKIICILYRFLDF